MSLEEGQRLLSNQAEDSEDEDVLFASHAGGGTAPSTGPLTASVPAGPPPSYNDQQAATLTPITLTEPPAPLPRNPPHGVPRSFPMRNATANVIPTEKPPDYSLHAPSGGDHPGKAGMAVHIQIDGRLVPGTIMEDASGRHMVYICQPQTQPSTSDPTTTRPPCPKDYFFLALISLICCCAPLGIFALIKSLEVHRLYKRGDYAGAVKASKQAHSWGSAAVVFGATMVIIVFALKLYFSESNHSSHYYYYQ